MDRDRNIVHFPPAPAGERALEALWAEILQLRAELARLAGQPAAAEA